MFLVEGTAGFKLQECREPGVEVGAGCRRRTQREQGGEMGLGPGTPRTQPSLAMRWG